MPNPTEVNAASVPGLLTAARDAYRTMGNLEWSLEALMSGEADRFDLIRADEVYGESRRVAGALLRAIEAAESAPLVTESESNGN